MNIKQAKAEITNTIKAYLSKDELGNYAIPSVRQRPVLLMGPPGIGKTQIMEQIAHETGIGLCAYTITHHTGSDPPASKFLRHAYVIQCTLPPVGTAENGSDDTAIDPGHYTGGRVPGDKAGDILTGIIQRTDSESLNGHPQSSDFFIVL